MGLSPLAAEPPGVRVVADRDRLTVLGDGELLAHDRHTGDATAGPAICPLHVPPAHNPARADRRIAAWTSTFDVDGIGTPLEGHTDRPTARVPPLPQRKSG